MTEPKIEAPADLEAWELIVDGDVYLLFAWGAPAAREPMDLTPAEKDVLHGVLRGESNAMIAQRGAHARGR